jgi:hypothetical protein
LQADAGDNQRVPKLGVRGFRDGRIGGSRRNERGDGVRCGPIEGMPVAVVPAGRARIGVPGGVLHVWQRYASVQRCHDETVAQGRARITLG